MSSLERNLKSPTLSKVDELAQVLGVHPLTLLAGAYLENFKATCINELLELIAKELSDVKQVDP